ncbi:MAG: hypothetical protein K5873_11055 [Treponema sp.]|nr:hypothetical protein [Treponema sp.]
MSGSFFFKKFLLSVIFFGTIVSSVFSQANKNELILDFLSDFVRKNWTTDDGLPGMSITTLMQDRKGYIWIGTYDGLVRFDGLDFKIYNRASDEKFDFASSRSVFQDSNDNIWIGHNDEGVTCLGPDGSVIKYTVKDGIPNNKVNAICEDNNGNIWIGTAAGLCYITPDKKIELPHTAEQVNPANILVVDLYKDKNGHIWITTGLEGSLFLWNGQRIELYTGIKSFKNPAIRVINEDRDGNLCFCVEPHYLLKVEDEKETVYDLSKTGKKGFVITSFFHDSKGNYWIGSDVGIYILNGNNILRYGKEEGIPDEGITRIIEDDEGNIWIGFNRGGLQKLTKSKFRTVPAASSVNVICEDKERGLTWIGSDDGLHAYDTNSYIENEYTKLCSDIRVRHVELTKDGEILLSTYSDKPHIRISKDGKVKIWTVKDGILTDKCRISIKIKNGDYYIGTPVGLNIIHHEDGHISKLTQADGFTNHYIIWLYEDEKGRVWVGTNGGGVFILENEKIIKHFTSDDGLAGNVIFKIYPMEDETWICTGTGLSIYNEEKNSFVNLNSTNGLGSDSIFQVLLDRNKTAWITTNKGVVSLPYSEIQEVADGLRKKVSARYYGAADGMITNGVTSVSCSMKDSEGRIWFPFVDGFAIYDPKKSGMNRKAARIEILNYALDNVTSEYYGGQIVIPANTKRFSIRFTGISYISSENIKFRFKLDGFDQEYSDWTGLRFVSYTNLEPGSYQFRVMSENRDGIKSKPMLINVIREPHFYELIWFWILQAFFILGSAFIIIRARFSIMKKRQLELEEKVEERTHELKVEKDRSESLLLNILPESVAKELTEHPNRTIAKFFPHATVLFTDIVGFTKMSSTMNAEELVTMLNQMISMFDERAKKEGVEKIKTIGDAYMAATGLSEEFDDDKSVAKMIKFAYGLMEDVNKFNENSPVKIQIRLGINTGELVAGVIGKSKFIYDIWGDTVNVASRMESTGQPMKIHVTEETHKWTKDNFNYSQGIEIEVKGKGKMQTYFL